MYYKWNRDTDVLTKVDDVRALGEMYETPDARRVALNQDPYFMVSTVFLGLDHSLTGKVPLVFETMIFMFGQSIDLYMDRYPSANKAREGHYEALDYLTDTLIPKLLKLGSVRRIKRFLAEEYYANGYSGVEIAKAVHYWRKTRANLELLSVDNQLNMAG